MNNTPTPMTETDLFEATKVSLEYGNQRLFKKSQSTRIVGEVAFSDGYEYALKHSSKIKQLERELTAARKELHTLRPELHTLKMEVHTLRDQRDRLAEALKDALYDLETSDGLMACDNEEGHSLFCLEQRSIPKARQAIQSLNQAAVKGGSDE